MLLLRKVLINLTVLAVILVLFYCYQTSNGVHWSVHTVPEHENTSTTKSNGGSGEDEISKALLEAEKVYYNVWCIFTKVASNSPMRKKFAIFAESLLRLSSVDIVFHVITDEDSKDVAEKVLEGVLLSTGKFMKVQYYDVHKLASQLEDIVSVMSPHFSSKPGTYYSDALFFLSLGLHRIAPIEQSVAAMFDADTKFRKDVKELFEEFNSFGGQALFGLAPELTPVYRHVLYLYRNKHPNTSFGEPSKSNGYPGYNSGVVLFNLDRLRNSSIYDRIVKKESVQAMTEKYHFKGHLGDQDFYTLLGMERPELIHTIDCGWNRQLCIWWRDRGYADVFGNYSRCDSETKLWHGNCNTPIPDD
ncbi:PREDICTED: xyloside xylosyltransferase 1 [Dufourea novaeangliae]|uniref:Xyloside xylosyltransferase 1 n=1 Tax=Dufourea novaeangliae TaxID=178035 RepID=A0A154PA53_DUFNO|nr:PREDICTED: xyloside xylosyltransferase 1 [Dufourea novaeangliae]KZC08816.1 Xyloside xylosyltransferase 1 [Dufourea novaeangliae]